MDLPRQTAKPSRFQLKIYALLRMVPASRVTTYAALAKAADCGSAQAVGQALRRNPFAPKVPCHRVVRSDGSLGGFFGESGATAANKKRQVLEAEGICFGSDGRVLKKFILQTLPASQSPHPPSVPAPLGGASQSSDAGHHGADLKNGHPNQAFPQ